VGVEAISGWFLPEIGPGERLFHAFYRQEMLFP
jgi:hypothetical protein